MEELYSNRKIVDDNKSNSLVYAVAAVICGHRYSSLIVAPKNQAAEEVCSWQNTTFQDSADSPWGAA